MGLYINGVLSDNNFCKTKTGSLDYIISINYKNGPYMFWEGDNDIEIRCIGRFQKCMKYIWKNMLLYLFRFINISLQIL